MSRCATAGQSKSDRCPMRKRIAKDRTSHPACHAREPDGRLVKLRWLERIEKLVWHIHEKIAEVGAVGFLSTHDAMIKARNGLWRVLATLSR